MLYLAMELRTVVAPRTFESCRLKNISLSETKAPNKWLKMGGCCEESGVTDEQYDHHDINELALMHNSYKSALDH